MSFYRKKVTVDKKAGERGHATRRAYERFGINANREIRKEIRQKIASYKALRLRRESRRISLYLVFIEQMWVVVVYDSFRHEPVTYLYPIDSDMRRAERHIERLTS